MSDGTKYSTLSCFECTPILVNGAMYISTPFCRVIALDPETGEQIWRFNPQIDLTKERNLLINRGVASWQDGGDHRIFYGTLEGDLWCLDARTGKAVASFGDSGRVRHGSIGALENLPHQQGGSITSPPTIYKNLVMVGGMIPHLRA